MWLVRISPHTGVRERTQQQKRSHPLPVTRQRRCVSQTGAHNIAKQRRRSVDKGARADLVCTLRTPIDR